MFFATHIIVAHTVVGQDDAHAGRDVEWVYPQYSVFFHRYLLLAAMSFSTSSAVRPRAAAMLSVESPAARRAAAVACLTDIMNDESYMGFRICIMALRLSAQM